MEPLRIGVVGPCASGKTTLTAGLRRCGYDARPIAQEHSYVQNMWQRITNPDILIYLSVSYPLTIERRRLDWTESEYAEQLHRLRHAREHADLTIDTNYLTPQGVLNQALSFLDIYLDSMNE
jgi:deoxyadenosine/deoxycytidine kinase